MAEMVTSLFGGHNRVAQKMDYGKSLGQLKTLKKLLGMISDIRPAA
jgi:hypothetical protein